MSEPLLPIPAMPLALLDQQTKTFRAKVLRKIRLQRLSAKPLASENPVAQGLRVRPIRLRLISRGSPLA
jgi:hypothetical protein